MDGAYNAIAKIPPEIWRLIFDSLYYWDSPPMLKSLSISCLKFYKICLPLLWDDVHIHFSQKNNAGKSFLRFLVADATNPRLQQCIRMVIISGYSPYDSSEEVGLLHGLLQKCERLVAVSWRARAPIPNTILNHLNCRQPAPRLSLAHYDFEVSDSLFNSPCVYSLTISCCAKDEVPDTVKTLIFSSQCLRNLKIQCRVPCPIEPSLFTVDPNSTFPAIRSLYLSNCLLHTREPSMWTRSLQSNHLRQLSIHGEIDMLDILVHLTGQVRNLTSLEIRIWGTSPGDTSRICTVVENFLKQVSHLDNFAVYDIDKSILPIVSSLHGNHLRSLRFLKSELAMGGALDQRRTGLSFDDLKSLGGNLPHVQRLGFNLNFEVGVLTAEILSGIARFPGLKHLEIYTPFPPVELNADSSPSCSTHPFVNEAGVERVFKSLDTERRYYQKTCLRDMTWPLLQGVDVKVGEWEPLMNFDNTLGERKKHIFACRRLDGPLLRLKTVFIPGRKPLFNQHESYERALASIGLWDKVDTL